MASNARQNNLNNVFGKIDPIDVFTIPGVAADFDEAIEAESPVNFIDELRSELGKYGLPQKNKFQVNINPPRNLSPGGSDMLRRLMIRTNAVSLPGNVFETTPDNNIYGPNRNIVSGITYANTVSVKFHLDDKFDVKKYFEDWQKLSYSESDWNIKYYNDYIGTIDIFVLDRNFEPTAGYRIWETYPSTIGPIEFDMSTADAIKDFTVEFSFRFWSDIGEHGSNEPKTAALRDVDDD